MPGTKQKTLDFMANNLGLGEDSPNNNWITRWYGMTGAWCMMTVSRALVEGGFTQNGDTLYVPGVTKTSAKGWAYCPYAQSNMRAAGWERIRPEVGAIVFFTWYQDPNEPDHVGIVARVDSDGTFWSFEGNQNNQLRLVHRAPSVVSSFMMPPYEEQAPPAPTPSKEDDVLFLFSTAPNVDNGSYWLHVGGGVALRMHLPKDVDELIKSGVPDFGQKSAAFHGVFDRRG